MSNDERMRQIKNAMSDLSLGPATLDGVLDALQDLHRLRHLYPPLREREQALHAFKTFVHERLDAAGVPTHPGGLHSKEGCRVGDRLDIALEHYGSLKAPAPENSDG